MMESWPYGVFKDSSHNFMHMQLVRVDTTIFNYQH